MMSLRNLIIVLLISIELTIESILNCENYSSATICMSCEEGYVLENNKCNKCDDSYCKFCVTTNKYSCYECKSEYILKGKICGSKCLTSISYCDICEPNTNNCIYCNNGCDVQDGKCSCSSRKLLIIFLAIGSFLIIIIIILCLTKVNEMRNLKISQLIFDSIEPQKEKERENKNYYDGNDYNKNEEIPINNNNMNYYNNEDNLRSLPTKSNDLFDDKDFDSKKICDFCLLENSVFILSCGCNLCAKHKTLGLGDKCPVCKKNINLID